MDAVVKQSQSHGHIVHVVTNSALSVFRPSRTEWLRHELAPFPGRETMTLRLVVAAVIVTVISMALQVPFLAYSGFFIFFVTKDNHVLTTRLGFLMILSNIISSLTSEILFQFTFDHPELRVPAMAGLIFTAMFLARVFVLGPVGFAAGFSTALILTITERSPTTEALVRSQLWLFVAIVYPTILTVIINQILLPADPWPMFLRALIRRLDTTGSALERIIKAGNAGGQNDPALLELATRGSSPLFGLLAFAEAKDMQLKRRHGSFVAIITASEHVIMATASLALREPESITQNDILCVKALLIEINRLRSVIQEQSPILSNSAFDGTTPTLPQLRELRYAIRSFGDSLMRVTSTETISNLKQPKPRLFAADAFTNPTHIHFALKVTLAAMVCYIIYSALDWPGISTSFITCCFIAMENVGATFRRARLRLIGCGLGGSFAFMSLVFLVPYMESITSLVLLVAAGTAVAGWIAAGTDRISYVGVQAAFAFYLGIFQGFAPHTDFVMIRDRLVGIVLGIAVTSIVFRYVWPERASDKLRGTLARVLRKLSQLLLIPQITESVQVQQESVDKVYGEIANDLDNTLRLSELTVFEDDQMYEPETVSTFGLERLVFDTQGLYLMTTALLRKTKLEEWARLEKTTQQAEISLRISAAERLQNVAAFLERGKPTQSNGFEASFTQWKHTISQVAGNDRTRLVSRIAIQVGQLTQASNNVNS